MTRLPGLGLLLFGVLAAPIAWVVQFTVHYLLAATACTDAWPLAPNLVTVACVAVAATALVLAVRGWRALLRDGDEGGIGSRARAMAFAGILASSFFLLVIIATAAPSLFFDPC